MEKIRNLRKSLSELGIEDLNEIQNLMEGGVEPESDEEVMVGEMFQVNEGDEIRDIESQWRDQFSHALSLLAECEVALNQEIEEREENLRDSRDYKKAINFLEVIAASGIRPNWEAAENNLESYGIDEKIIEIAVEDGKRFEDTSCEDTWPM